MLNIAGDEAGSKAIESVVQILMEHLNKKLYIIEQDSSKNNSIKSED